MSTNLYLAWGREGSVPLHIAARDVKEATEAFSAFVSAHANGRDHKPVIVREVEAQWLHEQPQLMDAVEEALQHDGGRVLYWVDHQHGWVAQVPDEQPRGRIAPIEALVTAYEVRSSKLVDDEVEVMIFASDTTQALQLYIDWHEQWHGKIEHHYKIAPFSRWTLVGDQTALREQMDIGYVGVAGWSPTTGWTIYPVDHELAGE